MELFSYGMRVLSGEGSISFLRTLKAKRLFLVTDPYFEKNGMAQKVAEASGAPAWEIFSEVVPDPSAVLAAKATAAFSRFEPDLLAALGGGSCMDLAKAVSWFSHRDVPFAAIPTTSGSGSEVTNFSILTHEGVKHPLVEDALRPDYAILDSSLLLSLPGSLIADSGFDVLSHALEAIAAKKAGRISDLFAKEAFLLAFQNLESSYRGDTSVRLAVHEASCLAGLAFSQAGLGICHGLSHSLGGQFHVPHGRLNAILLPAVISFNEQAALHRYADLARYAGLGAAADTVALRNLKNGLLSLRRKLNLPASLREAGVDLRLLRENQESIIASTLKDPCCETNPVPVDASAVREILQKVSGHV